MNITIPEPFEHIFTTPARFRVWYGGRGGGKSWAIARALLVLAMHKPIRVLCTRQYQISIADSSHRLLSDQINTLGLSGFFDVTKAEIRGNNGSLFIFRGLQNISEIKSLEGINICWVEEAEKTSNEALDMLVPTIRADNSEIWFTFNPYKKDDPMMDRYVYNAPDNAIVRKVSYNDNPWFPAVLRQEMEYDRENNPDRYDWVWNGNPRGISNAQVFKGKYEVCDFDTPDGVTLYHGGDWGFATDPSVLVRCWIMDKCLYIDSEAYGVGVEIDDTPRLFDMVPDSRKWKIYADSARPETISYMRRNGFPLMQSVKKWPGSVEDGVEYIRSFRKIYIHSRCRHTANEFELYQYKTDKLTGEVLPIIVDANNHAMDALRYALSDYIRARGVSIPSQNIRGSIGI